MKHKLFAGLLMIAVIMMAAALFYSRPPATPPHPAQPSVEPKSSGPRPESVVQNLKTPEAPMLEQHQSPAHREDVSPLVRLMIDSTRDYHERVTAISTVRTNLANRDWQALKTFLLTRDPADSDAYGQAAKNLVLDKLCALDPPPDGLADVIIEMYRDRTQDGVIRDYAVQHIAAYYYQLDVSAIDEPELRQKLQDVLWEALSEVHGSIAGTALLALQNLSEGRPEFDRERIADAALGLAEDGSTGELTRITAYQVCARMGVEHIVPLLEETALSGPTISLRASAIGALGLLGGDTAVPSLRGLAEDKEERLRLPAQTALRQIALRKQHGSEAK